MGIITSKQLKQKTGEVIRRVRSGERLTLTYRGKTVAIISPATEKDQKVFEGLLPFHEAWQDIEATLAITEPEFKDWKEATAWVRNKNRL